MFRFCLHSLFREYGWQFLRRVAMPHPLRTARAALRSHRLSQAGNGLVTSDAPPGRLGGARAIVGVGFCLKPTTPLCPSGRPNHDCLFLERPTLAHFSHPSDPSDPSDSSDPSYPPAPCRQCAIAEIGALALRAGAAFYIMTSARDILHDLFLPALNERRFTTGLFVLCRYSLRPFSVGLLASGIRARLFPFERGDCRDYRTWLQADRGIKNEQTLVSEQSRLSIESLLGNGATRLTSPGRFERRGSIFHARKMSNDLPQ